MNFIPIVYRYTDLSDNTVKYIGIITGRKNKCLEERLREHRKKNEWSKGHYKIDFFVVNSRTDAEAYESHLIEKYNTQDYYNKAKTGWGLSDYLPEQKWVHYVTYDGEFTMNKNRIKIEKDEKERIKNNQVFDTDISKRYSIWYSNNEQAWSAYVKNRQGKRKRLLRKNKEDLIKCLEQYYKVS